MAAHPHMQLWVMSASLTNGSPTTFTVRLRVSDCPLRSRLTFRFRSLGYLDGAFSRLLLAHIRLTRCPALFVNDSMRSRQPFSQPPSSPPLSRLRRRRASGCPVRLGMVVEHCRRQVLVSRPLLSDLPRLNVSVIGRVLGGYIAGYGTRYPEFEVASKKED